MDDRIDPNASCLSLQTDELNENISAQNLKLESFMEPITQNLSMESYMEPISRRSKKSYNY